MKVIKNNFLAWIVGLQLDCPTCTSTVELEPSDVNNVSLSDASTYTINCIVCGGTIKFIKRLRL